MNEELLRTLLPILNLTEEKRQEALSGKIKVPFFQRFGQEYREESDIPLGDYSSLASKVILEDGNLDLSSLTLHALAGYEHQVSVHGEKKVLNLLHRFKTNHKLRPMAAKMPENVEELDDLALSLLPSVIEAARILNTKPHLIVSRLKRIKRGNKANGKRLARMNKLAALLDENGNLPTDTATQAEFDQYVQLTAKNDSVVALQQLRNTKAAQDDTHLNLMNKLAATLDENGELPTDAATTVKFDQYVQSTAKKDSVVALQHLRNTKPKKREMVDEPGEKTSEPSGDLLREWGF